MELCSKLYYKEKKDLLIADTLDKEFTNNGSQLNTIFQQCTCYLFKQ